MLRVLFWLLEAGVLFLVGAVAFGLLCTVARSFTGVLRAAANMVLGGAISSAAGLAVGIGTAIGGSADPVGAGLLATIVSLPATLWVLERVGRRGAARRDGVAAPAAQSDRVPEPSADALVATAWARAGRLAPGHRQRLASARAACAYVLHWAESDPFDMDAVACAVLIRKRLPELVEKTDHYCRLAERGERRGVIDAMVGDLDSLGRMAMTRVERAKAQLGESLAATRTHIATRTSGEAAL